MTEEKFLAVRFEENREHLRAVANRMLGSSSEADDAVQEAWLHLSGADTSAVKNLGGWMTVVVARICLDQLRAKKKRREDEIGGHEEESLGDGDRTSVEHDVVLADSVGLALLVVLETLEPAERVAFVLHDMFDLPFDDIAPIVQRTPAAARQLASRARRRVRGAPPGLDAGRIRQKEVVSAFIAASRGGDFAALLAVLDANVVFHADAVAAKLGGVSALRGAHEVAKSFIGRATGVRPALFDGNIGAVWDQEGTPRVALRFTITQAKIVALDIVMAPTTLETFDWDYV
ncbi:MAG: sigma-70 family RNA polymerase sigma factor [Polyangiaceae bacterium]